MNPLDPFFLPTIDKFLTRTSIFPFTRTTLKNFELTICFIFIFASRARAEKEEEKTKKYDIVFIVQSHICEKIDVNDFGF